MDTRAQAMTRRPPPAVRALGYAVAAWCLGFAGVSVWLVADLVAHPESATRSAADASGLVVMSLLVLVLKLAGAGVALAAVLAGPGMGRRWLALLGVAGWGPSGCSPCTRPEICSSPSAPRAAC
jgi:hypothetical protein